MKKQLSYYFDLSLFFDKQIDINQMATNFKQTPYDITTNEEAVDKKKTAKLFYQTHLYHDFDLGKIFEDYVLGLKEDFPNLKQILKENNGEAWLDIVFVNDGDCSKHFYYKTIEILYELGVNFEICSEY